MKKYRLKDLDMKGVVIGNIADKLIILGDETSSEVELNNKYIYELCLNSSGIMTSHDTLWIYDHILREPPCFYDNETILERVADGWPIELGLVEEIPEEPKRVYMDRYEALRMVYEHGKKVAYDSEEFRENRKVAPFIALNSEGYLKHAYEWSPAFALNKKYNKKLWYVMGDK